MQESTLTNLATLNSKLWREKSSTTVCPISSDPFYVLTYYIKRVTTSWTYSITTNIIQTTYIQYDP